MTVGGLNPPCTATSLQEGGIGGSETFPIDWPYIVTSFIRTRFFGGLSVGAGLGSVQHRRFLGMGTSSLMNSPVGGRDL